MEVFINTEGMEDMESFFDYMMFEVEVRWVMSGAAQNHQSCIYRPIM